MFTMQINKYRIVYVAIVLHCSFLLKHFVSNYVELFFSSKFH